MAYLYILILIVLIILIYRYQQRKRLLPKTPSSPIKVSTSGRHVSIMTGPYQRTTVRVITIPGQAYRFRKRLDYFISYDGVDERNRTKGVLLSWKGHHSKDWYDKQGQFVGRADKRDAIMLSDPIGWSQRFVSLNAPFSFVNTGGTHLFERGHLIPHWASQDEFTQQNLVPLTQYTNKGFEGGDKSQLMFGQINAESMLSIESELHNFLLGSGWRARIAPDETLQVHVVPIYQFNNFSPIKIQYQIQLIGNNKMPRSFDFINHHIPAGHFLEITIPVQMSDGSTITLT